MGTSVPSTIATESTRRFRTGANVADCEGDPRRRPLDYDEVQALFDAADVGRRR